MPKPRRKIIKQVPVNCPFCKEDKMPNYSDTSTLRSYVTDRAKIIGKDRSGICSRHQRALSKAIKRARHLGLLSYSSDI